MILKMSDSQNSTSFPFKLSVVNTAPVFQSGKPKSLRIQLNSHLDYPIPAFIDKEENPITVVMEKLPSLFTKFRDNILSFNPQDPNRDLGQFII